MTLPYSNKDKLQALLADDTPGFTNINNMPIPGTSVEFSLLGIAGFKSFQVFGVANLPLPYRNKVMFKITDVKHNISSEGWTTNITSMILPVADLQKVLGMNK